MRLALVADLLPTFGGAEHVIAALHRLWPESPVYTTVMNAPRLPELAGADVRTVGALQFLYRCIGRHQVLLPLMPSAMEQWDLSGFDVVFSSSHAIGKGVIPPPDAVHVCYCHTPMRYAWEMEEEYLKDFRIRGFLKAKIKQQLKRLRRWDLSTARRVDLFIANSSETKARIARIYGRESIVIPPPVEDRFFTTPLGAAGPDYYLALGRLVPYKRFDLLIELANALRLPLVIGGIGQDERRLKAMAGPTVKFVGFVPDADLPKLYAGAHAVLFPQVEDAGIVPLEAQASGTPVIAYDKGGILDVIEQGRTGVLVAQQTVEAFSEAVRTCQQSSWDRAAIRENARRFSQQKFQERILAAVESARVKFSKR